MFVNDQKHRLHWLWKETINRLDSLARDVRECKNVMEASRFARWVDFSGLIQVFELNPCAHEHCKVDAAAVQKRVNDLIFECGELFRGGKADPKYAESDIAEINRKLDSLTALVKADVPVTVIPTGDGESSTVHVARFN